tara:strand:- start:8692 stop:9258 length:567 start_codon:yes stop_codon:yes gene_type:complete
MKKRSTSIPIEGPTDEQIKKKMIVVENVDVRGVVKRHRVYDQTIFDAMFLRGLIKQSHQEASHYYMDAITRSGGSAKGANLDGGPKPAGHAAGGSMAERRMAFSSAYRHIVDKVGEVKANDLTSCFSRVHQIPDDEEMAKLASSLEGALDAISDFYGTNGRLDPRDILRRQAGVMASRKSGTGDRWHR